MLYLWLYLCCALGFSFLCSIAEAVILCVTPSYIASLKDSGSPTAQRLNEQRENIDRPLAAILSLNTIAHTIGAAGVGAEAVAIFGSRYLGLISGVLTILILVFSEIIPKTIGALYWRSLAPFVARTVQLLMLLMYPFVRLSEVITGLLSGGADPGRITREEFKALAALGEEEGHLGRQESMIMNNLLRLRSLRVQDIMTPRTVVIAAPEDQTASGLVALHPDLPVSRIPVFESTPDSITGFVLKFDVLTACAEGRGDEALVTWRRDIRAIPEDARLTELFDLLLQDRQHIAIVVDQYGGMAGVVTLEDLLETLLGLEIVDEADAVVDMQMQARRRWEDRAARLGLHIAPSAPDNSQQATNENAEPADDQ